MQLAVLPDYLPARMLNEFVYCPRLFYYEWVDGLFTKNTETVEGQVRHARVDGGNGELAVAGELTEEEKVHARSVTLSSETHKLIAKLDLIEAEGETATPIDYKRGKPRENRVTGEVEVWDADRVQMGVQAPQSPP